MTTSVPKKFSPREVNKDFDDRLNLLSAPSSPKPDQSINANITQDCSSETIQYYLDHMAEIPPRSASDIDRDEELFGFGVPSPEQPTEQGTKETPGNELKMRNAYEALKGLDNFIPNAGIFAGNPPARDYCIAPLFESREVGVSAGPGGAGKSTMWTQAVFAVGTGEPFLGTWEIDCGPQKAWYLSGEDSQRTLHRRSHAIMEGLTPRQQSLAQKNVRLIPLKGMAHLFKLDPNGSVVAADGWKPFLEAVLKERPRLIVIDPFTSLTLIEEVNNTAITQCVRMLEQISEETGTSIIYLHHVTKNPSIISDSKGLSDILTPSAVRGGGAIVNAPRWASLLYPLRQKLASAIIRDDPEITSEGEVVVFKEVKKNGGKMEQRRFFRHSPDHGLLVPCFNVHDEILNADERTARRRLEKESELSRFAIMLAKEAVRREQTAGQTRMSPSKVTIHLGLGRNNQLSGDIVARAIDESLVHKVNLKDLIERNLTAPIDSRGGGSRIVPSLAALKLYGSEGADVFDGLRDFIAGLSEKECDENRPHQTQKELATDDFL